MKCYYRTNEKWFKGEIISLCGGRQVNFHTGQDEITISNVETLFHSNGLSITGYQHQSDKDNTYELVSVDVRFTPPRKGK